MTTATADPDSATAEATDDTLPPRVSAEIVLLPIDQIDPHPANPPHRSTSQGVLDLVELVTEFGQQEAGEVRQLANGRYQLLKGHRRHTALKTIGERFFKATVVECDDYEALRLIAVGNAGRQDLTPIERATLLQLMLDNGTSPHHAGKAFGLESESAVKNVVRLLQLPACIQDLVSDGTLPQRQARYFVPFAAADRWLGELAKEIPTRPVSFRDCSGIADWARRELRGVDGKLTHYTHWQFGEQPMRFELTDKLRKRLQVVDLPAGPKGAVVPFAQNVKLYDKLNLPAVKKYVAEKEKTKKAKAASAKSKKTPTAAELKEKAKKQAEQLKKARDDWKHHFERFVLATQTPANCPLINSTLPWLLAEADQPGQWIRSALLSLGHDIPGGSWNGPSPQKILAASIADFQLVDRLWRILVWPQWSEVWPGVVKYSKAADRLADDYPDKLPVQPSAFNSTNGIGWKEILGSIRLDFAAGWKLLGDGETSPPAAQLWAKLMKIHNTEQLRSLCEELKHIPECGPKRADLVADITAAHTAKPLPLPKFLQERKTKAKRSKG